MFKSLYKKTKYNHIKKLHAYPIKILKEKHKKNKYFINSGTPNLITIYKTKKFILPIMFRKY